MVPFCRVQPDSPKALVQDLDLVQVTLSLAPPASQVRLSLPGNQGAPLPPQSRTGLKIQNYMGSGGVPGIRQAQGGAAAAIALRQAIPKTKSATAKRTGVTKTGTPTRR